MDSLAIPEILEIIREVRNTPGANERNTEAGPVQPISRESHPNTHPATSLCCLETWIQGFKSFLQICLLVSFLEGLTLSGFQIGKIGSFGPKTALRLTRYHISLPFSGVLLVDSKMNALFHNFSSGTDGLYKVIFEALQNIHDFMIFRSGFNGQKAMNLKIRIKKIPYEEAG